jgi:hypothetical protein
MRNITNPTPAQIEPDEKKSELPGDDEIIAMYRGVFEEAGLVNGSRDMKRIAQEIIDRITAEKDAEIERLKEIISVQETYTELLTDELSETVSIASLHGWGSTRFNEGNSLRKHIEYLKSANL